MLTQINQVQTSVCPLSKTQNKTSSHSCSGTVSLAMHARRVIGGEKRGRYSFRKCFHFDKGQMLWLKMKQTQQPAIHIQQHTLVCENGPLACITLLPGHKRHNVADCEWNNRV